MRAIVTKKGDPMAFLQLEDYSGKAEIIVFPKVYNRVEQLLKSHTIFVVKGICDTPSGSQICKIKANDLIPIDFITTEGRAIGAVSLTLPPELHPATPSLLKETLTPGSAPLQLTFSEQGKSLKLATKTKITFTPQLMQFTKEHNIGVSLVIE